MVVTAQLSFAGTHLRNANVPQHAHPCPEIILIVKGNCEVNYNGGQLHAGTGDLILMPARMEHDQVSDGYVETIYAGFKDTNLAEWTKPTVITLDNCLVTEPSLRILAAVYQNRSYASALATSAILFAVLDQINHHLNNVWGTDNAPARLRGIIRYIEDHLADPISVESLAEQAKMSASNIHTLFRQHLKTSPKRYIVDMRMHLARMYLQDPYLTVKETAHKCGYHDVNNFIRVFHKEHGLSPGRWRNQQELD